MVSSEPCVFCQQKTREQWQQQPLADMNDEILIGENDSILIMADYNLHISGYSIIPDIKQHNCAYQVNLCGPFQHLSSTETGSIPWLS